MVECTHRAKRGRAELADAGEGWAEKGSEAVGRDWAEEAAMGEEAAEATVAWGAVWAVAAAPVNASPLHLSALSV